MENSDDESTEHLRSFLRAQKEEDEDSCSTDSDDYEDGNCSDGSWSDSLNCEEFMQSAREESQKMREELLAKAEVAGDKESQESFFAEVIKAHENYEALLEDVRKNVGTNKWPDKAVRDMLCHFKKLKNQPKTWKTLSEKVKAEG